MTDNLKPLMEFAAETVYLAGRLTLGYFQTDLHPDFKDDDTPVTAADRKAEELIRARIEKHFPDHAILGEEFGSHGAEDARCRWYLDPIDGTKAFVRGVPLYAVLLGLEVDGTVEVGAAYYPGVDEMLCAASGEGCWWNGRRARVSQIDDLSRAVVTCTDPAAFETFGRKDEWARISKATYHRAGWSDAYGYLLVATGRAEVALDPIMNDWDCGPFPPILQEAGGYFGDWAGNVTIHGKEALGTTRALLPEVLALIRGE